MHKKAVGAGEFYVGKIFSSIQQRSNGMFDGIPQIS